MAALFAVSFAGAFVFSASLWLGCFVTYFGSFFAICFF